MRFVLPILAFVTTLMTPAAVKASVYQCTAKVTEEVPVVLIHYKIPANVTLNFKEEIPHKYVVERIEPNGYLFDGTYDKLLHGMRAHAVQNDLVGSVLYRTSKETTASFTFSTEKPTFKAFAVKSADLSGPTVVIAPMIRAVVKKDGEIEITATAAKTVITSKVPYISEDGRAMAKFYSNEAAPTIKGSVQTTLKYRVNPDYDGELKLALDFNCARS